MFTSYRKLLLTLIQAREREYRSDADRQEAINREIMYVLQTMLEKLAATEDRAMIQQD